MAQQLNSPRNNIDKQHMIINPGESSTNQSQINNNNQNQSLSDSFAPCTNENNNLNEMNNKNGSSRASLNPSRASFNYLYDWADLER